MNESPRSEPMAATEGPGEAQKRGLGTRKVAGWLIVMCGVVTLANGFTGLFQETSIPSFSFETSLNTFIVCDFMIIIFGIAAVAGGVSAIVGKRLSLALAGAALGTLGGGIPGFYMGLASIVLLFLSNEDF